MLAFNTSFYALDKKLKGQIPQSLPERVVHLLKKSRWLKQYGEREGHESH
jgi:hypothetical protein